jgi:hypothetical protein
MRVIYPGGFDLFHEAHRWRLREVGKYAGAAEQGGTGGNTELGSRSALGSGQADLGLNLGGECDH